MLHVRLQRNTGQKPSARISVPDGVEIVIPDEVRQSWVLV
jgi:hypothetical protein